MTKNHFINPPPTRAVPPQAPLDEVRAEFAKRLQEIMAEKGWNQSETARRASKFMPRHKDFGRDNISCYVRGISIPRNEQLHALAQALGVKPNDLVPAKGMPSVDKRSAALDMRDVGGGRVWLRINTAVPWDTALEVMKLVKGSDGQSD